MLGNLADDKDTAHVDPAVLARRSDLEFLESDLGQKLGDEVLELGGSHRYQALEDLVDSGIVRELEMR